MHRLIVAIGGVALVTLPISVQAQMTVEQRGDSVFVSKPARRPPDGRYTGVTVTRTASVSSLSGPFGLGPAVVSALSDDSPAKAAGLTVGDTIVAVNGQPVTDNRTSFAGPPGAEVIYRVRRDGVEREVKFRVARKSRAGTEPAP